MRSSPMDAQDERGASPRRDRARLVAQLSDLDGRRYLRLINDYARRSLDAQREWLDAVQEELERQP